MIKEEYKDLPEDEFVPLTCVDNIFNGIYEINKNGQVRNKTTKNIFVGVKSNSSGYRQVTLQFGKTKHTYSLHRLMAKTFLENNNPEKTLVDHIDRNPNNNHISNLRWATPKENSLNRRKTIRKNLWFRSYDENHNIIKEVPSSDYNGNERSAILSSIRKGRKHGGYFWEQFNKEVDDLLKKLNKTFSELTFKVFPRDPKIYCSEEGILKIDNDHYTLGTLGPDGYRYINGDKKLTGNKKYRVHRVIYETFSSKLLEDSEIIDHIDTDRQNNQFSNLRICTSHVENKQNINTRIKVGRSVNQYDSSGNLLKTYPSASLAAEELGEGFSAKNISQCCCGTKKTHQGYSWKYSDQDPNTPGYPDKSPRKDITRNRLSKPVNQYDLNGNFIKTFSSIIEASETTKSDKTSIGKCCAGTAHTAGGYIWKHADTDPNTPEYHKKV